MKFYKTFDHTADLGLAVKGKSAPELYANCAFAVFDIITELSRVEAREIRRIAVEGDSPEDLLINLLREILYLYNGERWLLKEIHVIRFRDNAIEAEAFGEPLDERRHDILKEIKAVTYHQAQVRVTPDGWEARVIFDV